MNADFFLALEEIEKEKGISKEYMLEKMEQALLAALKKDHPTAADNLVLQTDVEKKKMKLYVLKTVVETVEDPSIEILLEDALKISKRATLGDELKVPIEAKKFGRIAAQAAKQVVIQGIREAERGMVYAQFNSKEHEILTGTVTRVDPRSGSLTVRIGSGTETTDAMLGASEQVQNESLQEGDRIKVYVVEVRSSIRGPQVLLSRTHPGLVKRLFELEVPEITEGVVDIVAVTREAGSRSKISVHSNDPDVDPVGSCVGPRGGRVASIVDELGGEKIDIIPFSEDPTAYVAAALSPADVLEVVMEADNKSCRVSVPADQLSLAIGREGQNVRLAAKLTGIKIDISAQ